MMIETILMIETVCLNIFLFVVYFSVGCWFLSAIGVFKPVIQKPVIAGNMYNQLSLFDDIDDSFEGAND